MTDQIKTPKTLTHDEEVAEKARVHEHLQNIANEAAKQGLQTEKLYDETQGIFSK